MVIRVVVTGPKRCCDRTRPHPLQNNKRSINKRSINKCERQLNNNYNGEGDRGANEERGGGGGRRHLIYLHRAAKMTTAGLPNEQLDVEIRKRELSNKLI